ncbi:MAG: response regulator [Methylobacter sp.]|nr:response regulator [Methylobacter sp.]
MKNIRARNNVLIVDDTPENLRLLAIAMLSEGYLVRVAPNGEMAIAMAIAETPDLVLMDIDMPGMDGYEVCDVFKANPQLKEVPIIFLSALHDTNAKVVAFDHGGVDYATKPFILEELLARVSTHIELNSLRQELEQRNLSLKHTISDQEHEINAAQMSTIVALAKLAESRDDDTGMHIDRVGSFSRRLAQAAQNHASQKAEIDDHFVEMIYHASALHDIGKVGIADAILKKPGKLKPEEFEIMKTHPVIGFETLNAVLKIYPNNPMIGMGTDITKSHHEKWNGSGYPQGLKGKNIPLSARIVAIADVYDALRAKRPYKAPFSHEQAVEIIQEGCGEHFDPELVSIFESIHIDFDRIWHTLQHRPIEELILDGSMKLTSSLHALSGSRMM